ncbi:MAG: sigma-70 family RNA polymerase sigma factor [Myxococcales bacterium]|nr:sigma-70 family RNA polymerase sigma factor [Myxococcales bacterium]
MPTPVTAAALAELDGLRGLARALAKDDADDLVQEAAIAALTHPPAADRPLAPWLATVLRNRWRMDRRAAARRRAREDAAPVAEPPAAPDQILARARTLERLAAALVALDEPFRTAIVRRFLDGHTAEAIAAELGVPAGTVRWRIKAGLERLRDALDRDAPRPAWRLALTSLATPVTFTAGATVKSKTLGFVIVALLVLLIGGGVGWRLTHGRASAPRAAATASDRAAVAPPAPRPTAQPPTAAGPAAAEAAADAPRPGARPRVRPVAAADAGVRGRVINWSTGDGVAGAELTFARPNGSVLTVTAGAGGGFAVLADDRTYTLAAAEAVGFLPYAPAWQHSPVRLVPRPELQVEGFTIYLFPALDYQGTVVDAAGAPVAGAAVRMLGAATGEQALAPLPTAWVTDASGGFTFHAPDDTVFEASAGGRVGRARLDGDVALTRHMTIRLDRDDAADVALAGVVVVERGAPIDGALVRAEPTLPAGADAAARAAAQADARAVAFATTDDHGRFTLRDLDRGPHDVIASADGLAAVTLPAVTGDRPLRIVLPAGAALTGQVRDGDGAPVPVFTLLVYRVRGVARTLVAARSVVDGEGRFREPVLPGAYELIATAPGWAASAPTTAAPDRDVTITLAAGAIVRGTVVSRATGAPLAYARVVREARGGGASAAPANAGTVTGEDGTFELTGVPAGPVALFVAAGEHHPRIAAGLVATDGATLGPLTIDLAPLAPGEAPTLELVGIGVKLGGDDDALRVDGVIPGGGAEAAGLQVGDRIVAVDGQPVDAIGLDGAIARIRGAAGTRVRLLVVRPPATAPQPFDVERRPLKS